MHSYEHWMKHTSMVPKGFLRHQVLRLLSQKPMSGSEITTMIEEQTNGSWKPGAGSIYPLLARLQEKGLIKETIEQEAGIKRYTITDQGKVSLQEHSKMEEEHRSRFRRFGSGAGLIGPMWDDFYPEAAGELRQRTRDLAASLWNFRDILKENYSEEAAREAEKILAEASERIKIVTEKLESSMRT